jgi:hypothetical protein
MSDREDERIDGFEKFWDFYVGEHQKKGTRLLHFIGTTAALGCIAGAVLTKRRWLLLLAPVVGYGPAWVGHFFVEKNKPATFKYPLWSLQADFVMWWKTVTGTMQAEVDRVVRERKEAKVREEAARREERASIQNEAVN